MRNLFLVGAKLLGIFLFFILVFSLLIPGCSGEAGNVPKPHNILEHHEPPTEDVPKTRVIIIKLAMESESIKEEDKPIMLTGYVGSGPPPASWHSQDSWYPYAAARDKIEGHVVVRFVVDTDMKGKGLGSP